MVKLLGMNLKWTTREMKDVFSRKIVFAGLIGVAGVWVLNNVGADSIISAWYLRAFIGGAIGFVVRDFID